jgi:hypothetical protein
MVENAIHIGNVVQLSGLQIAGYPLNSLNGIQATVVDFIPDSSRYEVLLDGTHKRLRVKPANLVVVHRPTPVSGPMVENAIQIGNVVQLSGLRIAGYPLNSLNGIQATVVDFIPDSSRYEVLLDGTHKRLHLKPANLVVVHRPTPARRSLTPPRSLRRPRNAEPPSPVKHARTSGDLEHTLRSFIESTRSLIEQTKQPFARLGICVNNRFADDQFVIATISHLSQNASAEVLVIGYNPSSLAKRAFDSATPSGGLVGEFAGVVGQPACWNILPGITLTKGGRDFNCAEAYQLVVDRLRRNDHDPEIAPYLQLVDISLNFIPRLVNSLPHVRLVWALGNFSRRALNCCEWTRDITVLHSAHPSWILQQSASTDSWLRDMVQRTLNSVQRIAPRSRAAMNVSIRALASGDGPKSFQHKLSVTGCVVRAHPFHRGGGSIRILTCAASSTSNLLGKQPRYTKWPAAFWANGFISTILPCCTLLQISSAWRHHVQAMS